MFFLPRTYTVPKGGSALMNLPELFFLAVGLSMDAFAVSVCKGLSAPRWSTRDAALVGAWFGGFQALMPLLGYFLGSAFAARIVSVDHWVAFALLSIIGVNMVREGLHPNGEDCDPSLRVRDMLPLALATSVDAMAVGVTFAFLQMEILPAVGLIGAVTFLLSALGTALGRVFGARCRARAELLGGLVLILMGVKILLEHLEIL